MKVLAAATFAAAMIGLAFSGPLASGGVREGRQEAMTHGDRWFVSDEAFDRDVLVATWCVRFLAVAVPALAMGGIALRATRVRADDG